MKRLLRFLPGRADRDNVKQILSEETLIVISVLKWVVLATCIGAIVGASTAVFLQALHAASDFASKFNYYFLLLPVAFFISAGLIKYLAPDAEGHGTEKVIEAIHKRSGRIKARVVPVKLAATVITIAAGGSAGKEGPCAQIGAGLSSVFADIFRFSNRDRKKLVICGISAGFASVFGTPIAGAIFGVEVLFAGSILYEVLLPSFIAGVTAFQVSKALGVAYFYHPLDFVPVFSQAFFAKIVLAGIVFGLCSMLLVEVLKWVQRFSAKLEMAMPLRGLIGGGILIVLALVTSTQYLGLGLDTIQWTLEGDKVLWYAFLLKILFTSITLNFGGSGGIVTPIFFIGCTAGAAFAEIMHLDSATFAAVGMVCLLAGSANTPIAASILSVEMFGPLIAPYATVACVISFLMTGHRSVYPSQVLAIKKTEAVMVEIGKTMDRIEAESDLSKDRVAGMGVKVARGIHRMGVKGFQWITPQSPPDDKPPDSGEQSRD